MWVCKDAGDGNWTAEHPTGEMVYLPTKTANKLLASGEATLSYFDFGDGTCSNET